MYMGVPKSKICIFCIAHGTFRRYNCLVNDQEHCIVFCQSCRLVLNFGSVRKGQRLILSVQGIQNCNKPEQIEIYNFLKNPGKHGQKDTKVFHLPIPSHMKRTIMRRICSKNKQRRKLNENYSTVLELFDVLYKKKKNSFGKLMLRHHILQKFIKD